MTGNEKKQFDKAFNSAFNTYSELKKTLAYIDIDLDSFSNEKRNLNDIIQNIRDYGEQNNIISKIADAALEEVSGNILLKELKILLESENLEVSEKPKKPKKQKKARNVNRNDVQKEFIFHLDRREPVKSFKKIVSRRLDASKPLVFINRGYVGDEHAFLIERFENILRTDFIKDKDTTIQSFNLGIWDTKNEQNSAKALNILNDEFLFSLKERVNNSALKKQIPYEIDDYSFLEKNPFLSEQVLLFQLTINDSQWNKHTASLLKDFINLWNFECQEAKLIFINIVHEENKGISRFFSKDKSESVEKELANNIIDDRRIFDLGLLEKINYDDIKTFIHPYGIADIEDFIKPGEEITWIQAYKKCQNFVKNSLSDANDNAFEKT